MQKFLLRDLDYKQNTYHKSPNYHTIYGTFPSLPGEKEKCNLKLKEKGKDFWFLKLHANFI